MENLRETVEYKEFGYSVITCPVCGKETLNNHYICPHCGWEYDGITDEDMYSPANTTTIKEYKESLK